jgi:hypothetical protein
MKSINKGIIKTVDDKEYKIGRSEQLNSYSTDDEMTFSERGDY